jgi:hypothetical protein
MSASASGPSSSRRAGPEERLGHTRGRDHRAERDIPRGESLRAGDQVGLEAGAGAREPVANAPEARDHRVGHEQDVVAAADRLDLGEIALRWDQHTPGTDDRLAEERRDAACARLFDRPLERTRVVPFDDAPAG